MALTAAQKRAIAKADAIMAADNARIASLKQTPEQAKIAAQQAAIAADPEVIAAKKMAAEIAAQTGQQVDPTTGQIIINQAQIAAKVAATPGLTIDGNKPPTPVNDLQASKDRILGSTLKSYGLEGIDTVIAQIRADFPEINQDDLLTLLKNDPKYNSIYNKRFAGNVKLREAGLPTLDDATYLKTEKEYEKIFKAYGVDNLANQGYYATLIGNRMDAVDVSNRIDLAYKVYKGNPSVKNAFNQFYGTVTDGDVVAAMLDPVTQVPLLQKKITVAEIGGAALQQNLSTSLAKAQDLEAFGVTAAQAQAGYSTIAQGLPTYEKLLEMRTGGDVKTADAQALLEETKLKKKAQAIINEQAVIGQEIGRFGGSTGRLASKDRAQGLI
jgi:hypothetical protein